VQACPTGALAPAREAYLAPTDRTVSSLCPYCGVGCQLTYHVKDNNIVRVEGRDGPANHDRLCVKGRFGFDYVHHPQRLTRPLIRKAGVPKTAEFTMDPSAPLTAFREAIHTCSALRRPTEALSFVSGVSSSNCNSAVLAAVDPKSAARRRSRISGRIPASVSA
jgi:predicted molibdopterin-dependent oxidoreductase YjgC